MKAFISHSSIQKTFAENIVDRLGRDQCILDAYDFQPAYTTMNQIVETLEDSSIFVFLITKESLESNWCQHEVSMAEDALREQRLKLFLPYIIDSRVSITDIPEWMSKTKCFNLKYFRSPILVSRDIDQKLRVLEWDIYPSLARENDIFVGRNEEIGEFQTKKSQKRHACCLIVSGRSGTGRHCFASRCARDVDRRNMAIPERIALSRDEGLEDVINQLNLTTCLYSDAYLSDILQSDEDVKIDAAVDLINEIYAYQGRVEITETKAIVNEKGQLEGWFEKIIRSPKLKKKLGTYIISSLKPRAYIEDEIPDLITVDLCELTDSDRRVIFNAYLEEYKITDISDDDIDYFVDFLLQSPGQLRQIARIIRDKTIGEAKRCISAIRDKGDTLISNLINDFSENEDAIQFLLLLSELEIASYNDIKEIYGNEYVSVEHLIPELINRSIISEFGPSSSFLRVDYAVADYLKRGKKRLIKKLRKSLSKYVQGIVAENVKLTEEPTRYMLLCKSAIEKGDFDIEKLLLPSIALKAIINLYNEGKSYDRVEILCKEILSKAHNINLMDDIKLDITYWLCQSLAHLNNERDFFKYVQSFDGVRKDFLLGFWYRQIRDYSRAKSYYEQVLKVSKMRKARNEIVIVLTMMGLYEDARKFAKEQYEQEPDNAYYITSLFKCVVLSKNKEIGDNELLKELIDRMERNIVKDKDQYIDAMKLLNDIKNLRIERKDKYTQISNLKAKYPDMIGYLKDAIEISVNYLGK